MNATVNIINVIIIIINIIIIIWYYRHIVLSFSIVDCTKAEDAASLSLNV